MSLKIARPLSGSGLLPIPLPLPLPLLPSLALSRSGGG